MTKVTYKLQNGNTVNSLAEAQVSGIPYKVIYNEIPEEMTKPNTEKAKALRVKATLA